MDASNPSITSIKSPLGPEHLAQIKYALQVIDASQEHINKAKQVGIDTSAQEKSLADSKAQLLQVKNVYFPGQ